MPSLTLPTHPLCLFLFTFLPPFLSPLLSLSPWLQAFSADSKGGPFASSSPPLLRLLRNSLAAENVYEGKTCLWWENISFFFCWCLFFPTSLSRSGPETQFPRLFMFFKRPLSSLCRLRCRTFFIFSSIINDLVCSSLCLSLAFWTFVLSSNELNNNEYINKYINKYKKTKLRKETLMIFHISQPSLCLCLWEYAPFCNTVCYSMFLKLIAIWYFGIKSNLLQFLTGNICHP